MAENREAASTLRLDANCPPLFDFCRAHKRIFLYGAGDFAWRYTMLLDSAGIGIDGYIVSEKQHKAEYLGHPVYSASEARELLRAGDGIVPAFEDCTALLVCEKLGLSAEDVLALDHSIMNRALLANIFQHLCGDCAQDLPEHCEMLPREGIESILIIRIDGIGDTICSTAFFRELRSNYPDALISVVCNEHHEPLLRNCPYIDKLYLYDYSAWNQTMREQVDNADALQKKIAGFVRDKLENRCYDIVFNARELLCGSMGWEDLLLSLEIETKYRIAHVRKDGAFDPAWKKELLSPYFSCIVQISENCFYGDQSLYMLKGCGLTVKNRAPELWLTETETARARELLARAGMERECLIAVGLKGRAPARCWSKENFRKLFELLNAAYGKCLGIVILGGGDAAEDATELARGENVASFAGKLSLNESAAMIGLCDLYIGPSTSLLHMATALRVPSVTLYHVLDEPSDAYDYDGPAKWGPGDDLPHVSLLPPPGLDGCHSYCRRSYAHCINLITPEQVFEAAKGMLEQSGTRRNENV